MKKKDIKSDPIKERIVDFINFIIDNSNYVWMSLSAVIFIIIIVTYYNNNNNKELQNQNLQIGILQNKSIHSPSDSIIFEYEKLLNTYSVSESYNQAYIYMLDYYLENNDLEKIKSLLFDVDFSSNDDMQNSYIYKIKGDYFNNGNNFEEAEANYINAYEYVPSYELKTLYCRELVDLYIENDKLKKAKDFFDYVKLSLDDNDNLNFTSKNNLDYIESKLLHLVK